jgi:hypothetical protein
MVVALVEFTAEPAGQHAKRASDPRLERPKAKALAGSFLEILDLRRAIIVRAKQPVAQNKLRRLSQR